MTQLNGSIGFIGGGHMAEAMIGALITSGLIEAARIITSDIDPNRLNSLKETYGVTIEPENRLIFANCDIIILAVKPQVMTNVLEQLAGAIATTPPSHRRLLISIAAGYSIQNMEKCLYAAAADQEKEKMPIIRVMPNTPALVLTGMSGMSGNQYATQEDLDTTRLILGAMGEVLEFPETDLDAVTALSGSGPAYVFYLAESMIEAGIALGLDPRASIQLSLTTIRGALKLMETGKDSPETLRRRVTSPGGTTEAALKVMAQGQVKENIIEAIKAAADRSKELSRS